MSSDKERIAELERERDALRKALEPFALADNLDHKLEPDKRLAVMRRIVCAEHFRCARQALTGAPDHE